MNLKYYLGLLFWIPVMVQSQNASVTVSHERSAKGEVTFMQTIHRILRLRLLSLLPA